MKIFILSFLGILLMQNLVGAPSEFDSKGFFRPADALADDIGSVFININKTTGCEATVKKAAVKKAAVKKAAPVVKKAASKTTKKKPENAIKSTVPPTARKQAVSPLKTNSEAIELYQKYKSYFGKDEKEEFKYLKMSAEKGHVEAQYWLGFRFMHGYRIPKDEIAGELWLKKAAHAGNIEAQVQLGRWYEKAVEDGGKGDYHQAVYWYQKAAEKGDSQAQLSLGFLYLRGKGVEINVVIARKWLQRAVAAGESVAKQLLQEISNCDDGELFLKEAEKKAALAKVYYEQKQSAMSAYYMTEGIRMLQQAALKGNNEAMKRLYNTGVRLLNMKSDDLGQTGVKLLFFTAKLGFTQSIQYLQRGNVYQKDIASIDINELLIPALQHP